MKKILVSIFILIGYTSFSQEKITVQINTQKTTIDIDGLPTEDCELIFIGNTQIVLDKEASKTLKGGVQTAIKWIELNAVHEKSFERDICRFRFIDESTVRGKEYVTLIFTGYSDGSFTVKLKSMFKLYLQFFNKKDIENFNDLLEGKSVYNEIDAIFKK